VRIENEERHDEGHDEGQCCDREEVAKRAAHGAGAALGTRPGASERRPETTGIERKSG
jgi:hypothetical protein